MEQLDPANLEVFVGLLAKAFSNGQYALTAVLGLIAAVFGVRKFLGPKYPALQTGRGGAVLTIAASALSGIALKILSGVPFSWALVATVAIGSVAAGWFSLSNSLFKRADAPAIIAATEKQALAAAVGAKSPTVQDIANGPKT